MRSLFRYSLWSLSLVSSLTSGFALEDLTQGASGEAKPTQSPEFLMTAPLSDGARTETDSSDYKGTLVKADQSPSEKKCSVPEKIELLSYVMVHGGYRFDKISNTTGVLFPNNYEMADETVTGKHLQIWETGGRALYAFDSHWYAKGFYYYGWIVDGHFSDLALSGEQNGNTQDGQGGFGYLSSINHSCSLGILGGWGFDEQKTILKNASDAGFNGLQFTSIWNGPWLGFDFFAVNGKSFLFNLGYEFHWAAWRGSWLLNQDESNAFSDQRKGGLSYGHVLYFDFAWTLACFCRSNLRIDWDVKYQNWSTQSTGTLNSSGSEPFPSSPINGPVSAITFLKEAIWHSIGTSVNLGLTF